MCGTIWDGGGDAGAGGLCLSASVAASARI